MYIKPDYKYMFNKKSIKININTLDFNSWLLMNSLAIDDSFTPFIDRIKYFFDLYENKSKENPYHILIQVCCMGLLCVMAENRLNHIKIHEKESKKIIDACENMKIILKPYTTDDPKFKSVVLDFYFLYNDFCMKIKKK
jgi:hypothetical protein